MNLHNMIETAVSAAEERASARLAGGAVEKVASVEETHIADGGYAQNGGDILDALEKTAGALDWYIGELGKSPGTELRQRISVIKEAKSECGPRVGGGEKVPDSATLGLKDEQNADTGQSNKQPKTRKDEKTDGGPKNMVASNEDEKRTKEEQPVLSKKAQREAIREAILSKVAAGYKPGPNISETPLGLPEGVSKAGEGPKASGKGANLVSTIQKVIDLKKGQGKALVRPELNKLLSANALSKKDDPTLHNAWRNTSKAGVKIAGASSLMDRINGERS